MNVIRVPRSRRTWAHRWEALRPLGPYAWNVSYGPTRRSALRRAQRQRRPSV